MTKSVQPTMQGFDRPSPSVETAPERRWGRWIWAVILLLILFVVVRSLARNPNLDWAIVGDYVFNDQIMQGLRMTIQLALAAEVLALVLGLLLGYAQVSSNPVARAFALSYVWLFRSIPVLVQILILGNLALFVPMISISIPFTSVTLFSGGTNSIVTPVVAAVLALALHDAAYNAEIFRSGTISVSDGQRQAAAALGLTWWQAQRHVVLPQAIPVMLPPAASQFITLIKATSLVSVIAVPDLLTAAQTISSNNLRTMELLFVASAWFMVLVALSTLLVKWIERRSERRQKMLLVTPAKIQEVQP